jgi:hypothetical protein
MVPDFALRIHAMIRSLREVVLPALPKNEMLAIDQANILVGYLGIMAEQHDRVFEYLLVELSEYAELLGALVEGARGAQSIEDAAAKARAALDMAAPILRMSIPRQGELSALIRSLKESVDELLLATRQDGTPAYRHASRKRVMQQAEQQILRERAWFRASGFELEPSQLPSIKDVLLLNRNKS